MIDHERLAQLEKDFGAEEVEGIIGAFLEEAEGAVEALRAVWSEPPLRAERLHFLKGCARTAGAVRLGALCEQMELAPRPDGFGLIEREFRAVREALSGARLREAG